MEDLKGNVIKQNNTNQPSSAQPIARAVEVNESEIKKFGKNFLVEGIKMVASYVWKNVLKPGFQKIFVDTVTTGVRVGVYGKDTGYNTSVNGASIISYGNTPYGSMYNRSGYVSSPSSAVVQQANPMVQNQAGSSSLFKITDLGWEERGKAVAVLTGLQDLVSSYGMASVADFYSLSERQDLNKDWTNGKWGWKDLSKATIIESGGLWIIRFPKIVPLENV